MPHHREPQHLLLGNAHSVLLWLARTPTLHCVFPLGRTRRPWREAIDRQQVAGIFSQYVSLVPFLTSIFLHLLTHHLFVGFKSSLWSTPETGISRKLLRNVSNRTVKKLKCSRAGLVGHRDKGPGSSQNPRPRGKVGYMCDIHTKIEPQRNGNGAVPRKVRRVGGTMLGCVCV